MSFKDQTRRRKVAEKRGRRAARRAQAMLLRQGVLHPVEISDDDAALIAAMTGGDDGGCE